MCDNCDVLGDQIANLREDLEQSEHEVSVVEDERDELDDKVTELEEQLANLNSKYEDLEIERDELEIERDQWKRELDGYDEDFETLRQERDSLKQQVEFLQATVADQATDLARLPRTADGAFIFPGMPVYEMVETPFDMWEAQHHIVEMGAKSLNVTKTCLFECYSHPQIGIDAKEGK